MQNNNFLAGALDDGFVNVDEAAVYSSRWIEDGSFVRLANVTLGYALPIQNLVSQFRNARVYFSVDNVFLLTSYEGYDPEVNTDAGLATQGHRLHQLPRAAHVHLRRQPRVLTRRRPKTWMSLRATNRSVATSSGMVLRQRDCRARSARSQ